MAEVTLDEVFEMGEAGYLPLKGIRVLEVCHCVMGPACEMTPADMGVEVFKVSSVR